MLSSAHALKGFTIHGTDGEIGKVKDFYFDDHFWTVRYLVVETGDWLSDRRVLLSPYALKSVDTQKKYISVHLTKKQIENSPSHDRDKPVSRQFEEAHYVYYGWPVYWYGGFNWGGTPDMLPHLGAPAKNAKGGKALDAHLRSAEDLFGHHVVASDGEIGHVADLILDDRTWTIRYLVIDTRDWWPGKKVLISPQWIGEISWAQQAVTVTHTRGVIKKAPEYTKESLLTRNFEAALHMHYGLPGYWEALAESVQMDRARK